MADKKYPNEYFIVAAGVIIIGSLIFGGLYILDQSTRAIGIRNPSARAQTHVSPSWKLLVHPAIGEPVEFERYLTQDECEAKRQDHIRTAVLQEHAPPSFTCVSMIPSWWSRLTQWLQK